MGHSIKKVKKGFTIIEVMIVLAVAGLIMLIVLVAIPQLQRNQRNSARRDVLGRIKTELETYSSNNNGSYPAAATASAVGNFGTPLTALGFFDRYFDCGNAAPNICLLNINDPQSGFPLGVNDAGTGATITVGNNVATLAPAANDPGALAYGTQMLCQGETAVNTGASARNFAVMVRLEGNASYCLDNR